MSDDLPRILQGYGRNGDMVRTLVPRKFAEKTYQVTGVGGEYKFTNLAQQDIINRNIEIKPYRQALEWMFKKK